MVLLVLTGERQSIFLLVVLPALAIAFNQGCLVGGHHAVHLLAAHNGVLKILLHLVYMLLELLEEGEHFIRLIVEGKNLLVLIIDGCLSDLPDKAEVVLDTYQ